MFDIMGKLNELKGKVEETRKELDNVEVTGESGNGKIKIEGTAARTINNVSINEELLHEDRKEELEDLLVVAINRTLEQAKSIEESELKKAAGGMLPPGFGI